MDIGDLSPKKLLHHGLDALKAGAKVAGEGVDAVKALPGEAVDGVKSLLPDNVILKPNLPPYTPLSAAERVKAEHRSQGLTYPQEFIQDKHGKPHEPVNLVVTGTKAELIQAFEKAGWSQASELTTASGFKSALTMLDKVTHLDKVQDFNYQNSPVSPMYMNGKRYEIAFNKNNDHNLGRDHLRIFDTGKKDASGRTVWEIAATRDIGLHIGQKSHGHKIDTNIDPERDMVMADLLQGGEVKDWNVAKSSTDPNDPRYQDYTTDRKVYTVDLKAHPDLKEAPHDPNLAHRIMDHMPQPVQDLEHSVDQKLTNFFKSLN